MELVRKFRSLEDRYPNAARQTAYRLWIELTLELDRGGLISGHYSDHRQRKADSKASEHSMLGYLLSDLADAFRRNEWVCNTARKGSLALFAGVLGRKHSPYLAPDPPGRRGDRPGSVRAFVAKRTVVQLVYYLQGKLDLRSQEKAVDWLSHHGAALSYNSFKTYRSTHRLAREGAMAKALGERVRAHSAISAPDDKKRKEWERYLSQPESLRNLLSEANSRASD